MTFRTQSYEVGFIAHHRRRESRVGMTIVVESMLPENEDLRLYRGISESEQELRRRRLGGEGGKHSIAISSNPTLH